MTSWLGPFGPGFVGTLHEKSRRYFAWPALDGDSQALRLDDDRGTHHSTRADEERTHAGDHAINEAEIAAGMLHINSGSGDHLGRRGIVLLAFGVE